MSVDNTIDIHIMQPLTSVILKHNNEQTVTVAVTLPFFSICAFAFIFYEQ